MRLFVALNLPADVQDRLHAAVAPLRRADLPLRWTRAEALHLTLKFLGEVEPRALADVERAVATATALAAPFTLRLAGAGAFPSLRRARVVWIGADAAPELLRLHGELEHALEPLGFAPEAGPFRPHLTLGRVRRGAATGELRRLAALVAGIRVEERVEVREVELMQSHLEPRGASYALVRSFPLSGSTTQS